MKNLSTARGQDAAGSSRALTSWPGTSGPTPESSRTSVTFVVNVSADQTIWLNTEKSTGKTGRPPGQI